MWSDERGRGNDSFRGLKVNKDNIQHAVTVRDAVFETQRTDRRKPSGELTEPPHCPPRVGDLAGIRGQAGQTANGPSRHKNTRTVGMNRCYSAIEQMKKTTKIEYGNCSHILCRSSFRFVGRS